MTVKQERQKLVNENVSLQYLYKGDSFNKLK